MVDRDISVVSQALKQAIQAHQLQVRDRRDSIEIGGMRVRRESSIPLRQRGQSIR